MDYGSVVGILVMLSLVELAVCAKNGNGNLNLGSPKNVKFEVEQNKLKLSWDSPTVNTTRCPIRGYRIRYKETSKKRQQTGNTPRNTLHFILPRAQRGKEYTAKVMALNCKGRTGAPSSWVKGRFPSVAVSRVPGPAAYIRTRTYTNQISIHWKPPQDTSIPVKGYKIGYGQDVKDQMTVRVPADTVNYTIEGLKPATQYLISLKAYNTMGEGRPLFDLLYTREYNAEPTTTPFAPPINVRAMILSPNTAWVEWTDPSLGKSQVSRDDRLYRVKYGPTGANAYMYKEVTELQAYLEDLVPFTLYQFSVSVRKDAVSSPYSTVVRNKTFEAAPGSSPRMLTADARTNPSRIDMTWQPPSKPNGIITGYLVLYTKDRSIPDTQWNVLAVENKTSATISKLPSDTIYYFRVQARNRKGYGPLSAIAYVRTPPTAIVVPALLQQPVIRSVRADSETSVLLSWSDPNQFDYYRPRYFIQFGPAHILVGQEDENGKKWSYKDTMDTSISLNVTPGVIYSFQVKAFSLDRYSEFSDAVLFIPNVSESGNTTNIKGNGGPVGLPQTKDTFEQQVLIHHSISAIIVWTELDKPCSKENQLRREKYKIRYYPLNNPSDVKEISVDGKMASIDNLKPNIVYEYQIQRVHPKYAETPWGPPKQIDTHVNN